MHDIAPAEIEGIDVTIKLANRDTISQVGIVRDVEVLCGKIKYPTDLRGSSGLHASGLPPLHQRSWRYAPAGARLALVVIAHIS